MFYLHRKYNLILYIFREPTIYFQKFNSNLLHYTF